MGLALFGCKGDESKQGRKAPTNEASAPATPVQPSASLLLDGKELRVIRSGELETPTSIAGLLPKGSAPQSQWQSLWFESGKRSVSYQRDLLAKGEARLYLQEGSIAVGIFPESPQAGSAGDEVQQDEPIASFSELSSIKVVSKLKEPSKAVARALVISLGEGRRLELDKEALESLCPSAIEDANCPLGELLAATGMKKGAAGQTLLLVAGDGEESLPLGSVLSGEFRDLLKLNKQKQWVFRRYHDDDPKARVELRGLERIELR